MVYVSREIKQTFRFVVRERVSSGCIKVVLAPRMAGYYVVVPITAMEPLRLLFKNGVCSVLEPVVIFPYCSLAKSAASKRCILTSNRHHMKYAGAPQSMPCLLMRRN